MKKQNTSYIFIPFCQKKQEEFLMMVDALSSHEAWESKQIDLRYMMKYITDKFNASHADKCGCFRYVLKENARKTFGLGDRNETYRTKKMDAFYLTDIELFCFRTEVSILAFRVEFEETDSYKIASAQYQLKKVSREPITAASGEFLETTLLEIAKNLVARIGDKVELVPFFYMNEEHARANVFTYVEIEEQENYDRELYYLKRCYNEEFLYYEDEERKEKEFFCTTPDVMWGFSSEAAVCLARPELGRRAFIQEKLYKNFGEQYLFLYLLILHQKYVLYLFLTRIGVGRYNDLATLEEYKKQLHEFETDFVFSCISEVPQYQMLYEKMLEVHELHRMYEDVREPLDSLSEIQREQAETKRLKSDQKINKALFLLSILTLFSALTDSVQFAEGFLGIFLVKEVVFAIQILSVLAIVAIVVYIVLLLNKKE